MCAAIDRAADSPARANNIAEVFVEEIDVVEIHRRIATILWQPIQAIETANRPAASDGVSGCADRVHCIEIGGRASDLLRPRCATKKPDVSTAADAKP